MMKGQIQTLKNRSCSSHVRRKLTRNCKAFAEDLPPASQFDFNKSAVVAAFAGTKNTGGYSVGIKKSAGKIAVELNAPPKDAMTTQALTTPYKIVLINTEEENDVLLNIAETWQNAAVKYNVTAGEFEYSGGITGRGMKFKVHKAQSKC